MNNKRPVWDFNTVTEAEFRRVYHHGMVVSVIAKSKIFGVDSAKTWLEAGNTLGETIKLPANWKKFMEFYGSSCSPGLFKWSWEGERMLKRVEEIDAWEKQNKDDRAMYEKLKQRFGNT